jgi:hypothetical protein
MDAGALIATLGMQPHPEGGWYKETWRAASPDGERAGASAIYFILEAGQRSHWHKVDAAEIWLWHAGAPIALEMAPGDAGPVHVVTLGGDLPGGETPQYVIEPGHWQAARSLGAWTLVSCIVSPGFEFDHFTLAPEGWSPGSL